MPYALRKAPGKNKYWVVDERNKKYSKDPLSKVKAEAQRRALYASEGRGGAVPPISKDADPSTLKKHDDFIKGLEEKANRLFAKQAASLQVAKQEVKEEKSKREEKVDLIEQKDLEAIKKEESKILKEPIGSGVPESDLAKLLTLFSQRNKKNPKNFIKHLNNWIQKELKGGKYKPCPPGTTDNKAGLCVEGCKDDERDDGLFCMKKCPPNTKDTGIECIDEGCPDGYNSTLLTCYKPPGGGQCSGGEVIVKKSRYEPITCTGDWKKAVWEDGHMVCRGGEVRLEGCPEGYVDDGALCRKPIRCAPIIPPVTTLKRRTLRTTRPKKIESSIDWEGSFKDIESGLEEAFKVLGDEFASKFDPEKNGVADSFRKFGVNTKEAFEDIGRKIEAGFVKAGQAIYKEMENFGQLMIDTAGNEEWWKKTMSDPHTYVTIIGVIATIAAVALSGGALAPAAAGGMSVTTAALTAALSALGPCLNMITDAAEGKVIDVTDIIALSLAIIPLGGSAAQAAGRLGFARAGAKGIIDAIQPVVRFTPGTRTLANWSKSPLSNRTGQKTFLTVGQFNAGAISAATFLVAGTNMAQKLGFVPKLPIINRQNVSQGPGGPNVPQQTACDKIMTRWAWEYEVADSEWTADCKKPECIPDNWDSTTGCKAPVVLPPTDDKEELYKRAVWKWGEGLSKYMDAMPDDVDDIDAYERAYKFDVTTFPEGFTAWTEQYPEPQCFYPNIVSSFSRKCVTEEEYAAERELFRDEEEDANFNIDDFTFGSENNLTQEDLAPGDSLDVDVYLFADLNPDLAEKFSTIVEIPYGDDVRVLDVQALREYVWDGRAGERPIPKIGKEELEMMMNTRLQDFELEKLFMENEGLGELSQEQYESKMRGYENALKALRDVNRPIAERRTETRQNKVRFEEVAQMNEASRRGENVVAFTAEEKNRKVLVLEALELYEQNKDDASAPHNSYLWTRMPYTPAWWAFNKMKSKVLVQGFPSETPSLFQQDGNALTFLFADPVQRPIIEKEILVEMIIIQQAADPTDSRGIGKAVFERIKTTANLLDALRKVASQTGKPWSPTKPVTPKSEGVLIDEIDAELTSKQRAEEVKAQEDEIRRIQAETEAKNAAASSNFVNPEEEGARRTQEEIARQQAAARGGSRRCVF